MAPSKLVVPLALASSCGCMLPVATPPDAIVFAHAIPRTSAGKFQKSELRERYASWTWPPATTSS